MKKFLSLAGFLMVLASFVSCLNDDEESVNSYYGFFTIGKQGDTYVLYGDKNVIAYPTAASVSNLTSGKGFGENKRAEFYFEYDRTKVEETENGSIAHDVELRGGQYIQTLPIKLPEEAKAENINVPDSIFPISRMDQVWTANGYLNAIVTGNYSSKDMKGIRPTANMVLEYDENVQNTATLRLLYNRHSSKTESAAGSTQFITSYDAKTLLQVPGSDSISVTVLADGTDPLKIKVARRNLMKPSGV